MRLMNNKAFTLVELIGVIVIIGLMATFVIPEVNKSLKQGSEKANEQTKNSIVLSAKNYFIENKGKTCVKVSDLQSNGYIDIDLDDEYNNACVKKESDTYEYKKNDCNPCE